MILTHQARRSFRSAEFPRATRRRCASEGNGRSRQDAVEQASEEGLVVGLVEEGLVVITPRVATLVAVVDVCISMVMTLRKRRMISSSELPAWRAKGVRHGRQKTAGHARRRAVLPFPFRASSPVVPRIQNRKCCRVRVAQNPNQTDTTIRFSHQHAPRLPLRSTSTIYPLANPSTTLCHRSSRPSCDPQQQSYATEFVSSRSMFATHTQYQRPAPIVAHFHP